MRLLVSLITKGGIPAFFFSYVLMLLWNSLIADHFGWAPPLSYLQTAGLWFLVILSFAWAGVGSRSLMSRRRRSGRSSRDDRFEQRDAESQACGSGRNGEWEDVGARVERKIKRGFARWVGTDEETDWEDLGTLIERKIRRCVRGWVD
ncbi:MAG: hypothetical protein WBC63_07155 [Candidatus Bipolaricaulia bacterium]